MKIPKNILLCTLSLLLCLFGIVVHHLPADGSDSIPADTRPEKEEEQTKQEEQTEQAKKADYIKYIDFTPTETVLRDALQAGINAHEAGLCYDWIDLLALLATKYGGNFSAYKKADLRAFEQKLSAGQTPEACTANPKLLAYYHEAYEAVLGGMVGAYTEVKISDTGNETSEEKYGLRVFSPIARGYHYNDYDDFGASRSYGYKRSHLGHDIMGSIGTPIVAVESGTVTALGWNQYGGWRIGITSFDGKRYYYYAHLRRDHPYNDLYEGKIVNAGEVIGYLGMTGYSAKENVNNIDVPHLHYGLEIIFDPSQKDGWNQIWIDMYHLTAFLSANRAPTAPDSEGKGERNSLRYAVYAETPD